MTEDRADLSAGDHHPYRCPRCRRETGFKYVSKTGTYCVGSYTTEGDEDVNRRASCRFCGFVRKDARAV